MYVVISSFHNSIDLNQIYGCVHLIQLQVIIHKELETMHLFTQKATLGLRWIVSLQVPHCCEFVYLLWEGVGVGRHHHTSRQQNGLNPNFCNFTYGGFTGCDLVHVGHNSVFTGRRWMWLIRLLSIFIFVKSQLVIPWLYLMFVSSLMFMSYRWLLCFLFFNFLLPTKDYISMKKLQSGLVQNRSIIHLILAYRYKRCILNTDLKYMTLALKIHWWSTPCLARQSAIPFVDLLIHWSQTWERDTK